MFNSKQQQLFNGEKTTTSVFVNAGLKKSAETKSENGALKYSTTGNPFVDQFGKIGSYKQPRTFQEIEQDCNLLWATNKRLAILFIFFLRTITRITLLFNGYKTKESQKSAGMKHEAIFRMIWLHTIAPNIFWKNITLFIAIGSWKDVFTMLSYDLQYNGWDNKVLNWSNFANLILSGLQDKNQSELIKKYLPQIKANSNCKTLESQADNMIAKWICSQLFGNKKSSTNYREYRLLKSSGTAHQWQQLISQRKFDKIDFAKIHGRALNLLVKGKFLTNQGLREVYDNWAKKESTIKYTGFVCELFQQVVPGMYETINKQFAELVRKAGEKPMTNFIVVRDTSASMGSIATGTTISCFNIAKAIALFFSEFLTGKFKNAWIEFNHSAKMHIWQGNTPVEKWINDRCSFYGSTNFQSVIQLFVDLRRQGIPEKEFPNGILCISDSEFNPTSLNQTNVEEAKQTLASVFSKEYVDNFKIVLWNLQRIGGGNKFETYGQVDNVFYFSGYDASIISFLTGEIKNAWQLFENAMNQEVLNMIDTNE